MTIEKERREDCRHEVLRYLAERPSLAFRASTIAQKLHRENHFTIDEINDALVFLVDSKHAKVDTDSMGSTEFFQITSAGMLAHERAR